MRYWVFETAWGWAGLAGDEGRIAVVVLPLPSPDAAVSHIREKTGPGLIPDRDLFVFAAQRIKDYFAGAVIQDWQVEVDFTPYAEFTRTVFEKVRRVRYGERVTYSELAALAGRPGAARAVGQALKRNSCPLIIPCHRVVGVQGLGGFTAPGGTDLKRRLLEWEQARIDETMN